MYFTDLFTDPPSIYPHSYPLNPWKTTAATWCSSRGDGATLGATELAHGSTRSIAIAITGAEWDGAFPKEQWQL